MCIACVRYQGLPGDNRIAKAARALQDWFAVAVAGSQMIFVLLSLFLGLAFLATSGSFKDIFLNLLAVGFIPSVGTLVVQALRKGPFSRDADEEWQSAGGISSTSIAREEFVCKCLGALPLWLFLCFRLLGPANVLPHDHRFRTSCRTTLAEDRGVMALTWNASSGQDCVRKTPNMNLSNLRSADVILLVSISLKRTTTMLDDVTQLRQHVACNSMHSTKAKSISNATSQTEEQQHGHRSRDKHRHPIAGWENQIRW